ncbi:MAG TPA: S1 RNA-binding domain-containing protein [Candidatus Nanoarchaeia archaeon]|nr:S1 RNA-binding domain-containing protein [Candidatus Nanoarchaeia archaeon]
MFYKRQGIPEEDEIVLCKVTQILPNSVFVELVEYEKQGMVHISEIAPGRIRNLRDYVSDGREIICKVLRINRERGHIDLSLRRVNSTQRAEKLEEIKQEIKAETLIKNIAKKLKQPAHEMYTTVTSIIFKEYSHLYLCFKDIVEGTVHVEKLGLEKNLAQEITTAVLDKFKPQKIELKGVVKLETYASAGVDKIKSTLQAIEKISSTMKITYLGAGRYKLTLEDTEYKPAEKKIELVQRILEQFTDKLSTASFEREKTE